jgi:hypothetical protein
MVIFRSLSSTALPDRVESPVTLVLTARNRSKRIAHITAVSYRRFFAVVYWRGSVERYLSSRFSSIHDFCWGSPYDLKSCRFPPAMELFSFSSRKQTPRRQRLAVTMVHHDQTAKEGSRVAMKGGMDGSEKEWYNAA